MHMHRVHKHVPRREVSEETQRHGHGEVPVPAALRLLASRPLLPSAAAWPGSHPAAAGDFGLARQLIGPGSSQLGANIGQVLASIWPGRTPRPPVCCDYLQSRLPGAARAAAEPLPAMACRSRANRQRQKQGTAAAAYAAAVAAHKARRRQGTASTPVSPLQISCL